MQEKQEEITEDVFNTYGYKPGQEVFIPIEFIYGVLAFCEKVKISQPKVAALSSYPTNVREIKDKNTGELIRVDADWKLHNKKSFFNTALNQTKDQFFITTDLEMTALQIENALYDLHINNINNGVATKLTEDVNT